MRRLKHYLNEVPLEDGIKRIVVCTYWDADAKSYICAVHKARFSGGFERFIPGHGRAVRLETAGRFSATKLKKLHDDVLGNEYVKGMVEWVDQHAEIL
jgi:hypothetical protein